MKINEIITEAIVDPEQAAANTITIEDKQAFALLTEHCSDALNAGLKDGIFLYRGITGEDRDYISMDPTKFERRSQNTTNEYTEFLSNYSAAWKKFPPRNRSLICATNRMISSGYGTVYLVFPQNGTEIGICPDSDFWSSFNNAGIDSMADFAESIASAVRTWAKSKFNVVYDPHSPSDQSKKLYKLFLEQPLGELIQSNSAIEQYLYIFHGFPLNLTVAQAMEKKLDPETNGFYVDDTSQLPFFPTDNEVWFSNKCILVRRAIFEKLVSYETSF